MVDVGIDTLAVAVVAVLEEMSSDMKAAMERQRT